MKTIIKVTVCGAIIGLEYLFVRFLDKELVKQANEEANKNMEQRLDILMNYMKKI